ncbi:MAG: DUF680 domain-containing protein [Mesorhizobium sp.]|uniref:DUF680 domain-containing protein n=1 Tax=Mesorhizobium sp. TaxID=1871066 RepID=UPI001ACF1BF8|nr:DUF680 domain-containing protein [Mesorhizobium sp.]MBN9217721.1 DUF680 domain-containing protein [Mesorhizobium sp.]
MTKLALGVAAMLLASSSAFAGSDHFNAGPGSQPVANVDSTATASIPYTVGHKKVATRPTSSSSPAPAQSGADDFGPPVLGMGG